MTGWAGARRWIDRKPALEIDDRPSAGFETARAESRRQSDQLGNLLTNPQMTAHCLHICLGLQFGTLGNRLLLDCIWLQQYRPVDQNIPAQGIIEIEGNGRSSRRLDLVRSSTTHHEWSCRSRDPLSSSAA